MYFKVQKTMLAALYLFIAMIIYGETSAQDLIDFNQKLAEMTTAAENGNPIAQFNLGALYDQGGSGYDQDQSIAIDWYEKSAAQGFAPAQYNLGSIILGFSDENADLGRVVELFHAAAVKGLDKAQADLGHLYRRGIGVEQNYVEALHFYRLAANQGHVESMFAAGLISQTGGYGLKANQKESVIWFQMGAMQEDSRSQTRLASKLFKGEGVDEDPVKAYAWLTLAASKKNAEAIRDLRYVSKSLSADEIKTAKKLAIRCRSSNYLNCPQPIVFN